MPIKIRITRKKIIKKRKARAAPRRNKAVKASAGLTRPGLPVQTLSYRNSPFPPVLITTFKYTDYVRHTTSTSGVATSVFKLNDIYDPVSSGWTVNGQPFFHDQLLSSIGPYYKNCVYGVKVKITMTNNSSSSGGSVLLTWAASANYYTPATSVAMAQYAGEPNTAYYPSLGVNGNSSCKRTFKKYFDMAEMFGLSREQLFADDKLSGYYNASPVNLGYLQLASSNDPVSSSSSSDIGFVAKVIFLVKCFELMPSVTPS